MGMTVPKYTFEVQRSDEDTSPEIVIGEFDTIERARKEANDAFHEMAMDVKPGVPLSMIQITVKNESGQIVARRSARFEAEDF